MDPTSEERIVLIDTCAVHRFAEIGADPVADLAHSEFKLSFTPDLKREYGMAMDGEKIPQSAKELFKKILDKAKPFGFFGFSELDGDTGPNLGFGAGVFAELTQSDLISAQAKGRDSRKNIKVTETGVSYQPSKRTDLYLVALAKDHLVITDNTNEPHWISPLKGKGRVIQWRRHHRFTGNDNLQAILHQENNSLAAALRRII